MRRLDAIYMPGIDSLTCKNLDDGVYSDVSEESWFKALESGVFDTRYTFMEENNIINKWYGQGHSLAIYDFPIFYLNGRELSAPGRFGN